MTSSESGKIEFLEWLCAEWNACRGGRRGPHRVTSKEKQAAMAEIKKEMDKELSYDTASNKGSNQVY